jgi:hypothetical protein
MNRLDFVMLKVTANTNGDRSKLTSQTQVVSKEPSVLPVAAS